MVPINVAYRVLIVAARGFGGHYVVAAWTSVSGAGFEELLRSGRDMDRSGVPVRLTTSWFI